MSQFRIAAGQGGQLGGRHLVDVGHRATGPDHSEEVLVRAPAGWARRARRPDPLDSLDGLRSFLGSQPWLVDRAQAADLAPLVRLRRDLRAVFDAAHDGRSPEVVERLNGLLRRHHPRFSISGHDDSDWHLHVADFDDAVATRYAADAVMGLTMAFLDVGVERFGRYCSDRCATRANVAAHRERQRSSG